LRLVHCSNFAANAVTLQSRAIDYALGTEQVPNPLIIHERGPNSDNRRPLDVIGRGRTVRFYKTSIPIIATAALFVSVTAMPQAHAFNIKSQTATSEESDVSNKEFERAAFLEARAYICGTDEASEAAMKAGMKQTGLPEDIAVEIVSDLASGIIDKAVETKSKEICGRPKVQLSHF
jgi:hypothetical protein